MPAAAELARVEVKLLPIRRPQFLQGRLAGGFCRVPDLTLAPSSANCSFGTQEVVTPEKTLLRTAVTLILWKSGKELQVDVPVGWTLLKTPVENRPVYVLK